MGVARTVRRGRDRHAVAQRLIVLVDDVLDFGDLRAGDNDALHGIAVQDGLNHPAGVLLLLGVGLHRQAGLQIAGHVVVAVNGLQHLRVQRLDQLELEGVRLLGLVGVHGIAAPCLDAVALGGVGIRHAVLADVPQRLKCLVQLRCGVGGQRRA